MSIIRPWLAAAVAVALVAGGCADEDAGAVGDAGADTGVDSASAVDTGDAGPHDVDDSADVAPDVAPDTALPDTIPDAGDTAGGADSAGADTAPDAHDTLDVADAEDTAPPPPPAPVVGEVIFTEIMVDPDTVSDVHGEWLEIHSLADGPRDLRFCALFFGRGNIGYLEGDAAHQIIDPGQRYVIAKSEDPHTNGGLTPDLVARNFLLSNQRGEVSLRCRDVDVDRLAYDANDWVLRPGAAVAYQSDSPGPEDNDDPTRWCAATQAYGDGDLGSPGAANGACPPRDESVDACTLLQPQGGVVLEDGTLTWVADLQDAGFTDVSSGVDPIFFLAAEAGVGPAGTTPGQAGWQWRPLAPLPGYDDTHTPGATVGSDRYTRSAQAQELGLTPEDYAVAARFSFTRGAPWQVCDPVGTLTVAPSPCLPNPCVHPAPPRCTGPILVVASEAGGCAVDDSNLSAFTCTYETHDIDCVALGGTCTADRCVGTAPAATVGDVVITELMPNPHSVFDSVGEWVELTNVSGRTLNLAGCALRDDGSDHVALGADPRLVPHGTTLVLGRSDDRDANGGVAIDVPYGDAMTLGNEADVVALHCAGTLIDRVAYHAAYPLEAGRSLSLNRTAVHAGGADANDLAGAWCAGALPYPDAEGRERGTPGAPNHTCPQAVDRCRLLTPVAVDAIAGAEVAATGAFRHPGLTDVSAGVDAHEDVRVGFGVGPEGVLPTAPSWTWVPAAPTAGWQDAGGFDGYAGTLTAPAAGAYDLAMRVTVDGGLTWTVCDRDTGLVGQDGSEDGYQAEASGMLSVQAAGPCAPNPCVAPAPPRCEGDVQVAEDTPGGCSVDANQTATCAYVAQRTDCGALGGRCAAGACEDTARAPSAGDVVISELMIWPAAVSDFFGEWVEVSNVTDEPLDLSGCVVAAEEGAGHALAGPLLIGPAQRRVFGRRAIANGGVSLDAVWGDAVVLAQAKGMLSLRCAAATVDRVTWGLGGDTPAAPQTAGVARQLSAAALNAAANDVAASWCDANTTYGAGDFGTPGGDNRDCGD